MFKKKHFLLSLAIMSNKKWVFFLELIQKIWEFCLIMSKGTFLFGFDYLHLAESLYVCMCVCESTKKKWRQANINFPPQIIHQISQFCTYFPSNLQGTTFLLILIITLTSLKLDWLSFWLRIRNRRFKVVNNLKPMNVISEFFCRCNCKELKRPLDVFINEALKSHARLVLSLIHITPIDTCSTQITATNLWIMTMFTIFVDFLRKKIFI